MTSHDDHVFGHFLFKVRIGEHRHVCHVPAPYQTLCRLPLLRQDPTRPLPDPGPLPPPRPPLLPQALPDLPDPCKTFTPPGPYQTPDLHRILHGVLWIKLSTSSHSGTGCVRWSLTADAASPKRGLGLLGRDL